MKMELRTFTFRDYLSFLKALRNKQLSEEINTTPFGYIIKRLKDKSLRKNNYKFAIIVNKKFVGSINLYKNNKNYEIGFFIIPSYRRKNIATQSVKKALKFTFKKFNVNKIRAQSDFTNIASSKVLNKLGFKERKINKRENNIIWEIEK